MKEQQIKLLVKKEELTIDEVKEILDYIVNNVKSKLIQNNYWFDLGTQEQLKEASSWLLSQK